MIPVSKLPLFLQGYFMRRILRNNSRTYILHADHIECLTCGVSSYSKGDMNHLFCLNCGFHNDNVMEFKTTGKCTFKSYNG